MRLSLINHLLQSYGYFAVFAFIALESLGIPLPGETTLIAAAVYAGSTHHLNIGVVFLGLGAAATGVGQTITLVGLALSGVLSAAGIVLAGRWMRRLEQRAQAAYPDPEDAHADRPSQLSGPNPDERVPALRGDD